MKKENWVWMPHAAHLCVSNRCRFHLATYVGGYIVSTVGEYVPARAVMQIKDPELLKLRGDDIESTFLKKHDFETVGVDRKYETYVFPASKRTEDLCCPYEASDWMEIDSLGYNSAEEAYKGHLKLCKKWAKKKQR